MECAAAGCAPISYLGDAMAERTKEKRQAAPAAEGDTAAQDDGATGASAASAAAPAGKSATGSKSGAKSGGGRSSGSRSGKSAASKASGATSSGAAKSGRAGSSDPPAGAGAKPVAKPKATRSAAETERIRAALAARLDELREEYQLHVAEIAELQRDRFTDSAGDDQADTGSKTFEREQEISLAQSIRERTSQVERALERLDEGHYGWCERCGDTIPVERLAAFPSATRCVACKQLEERR